MFSLESKGSFDNTEAYLRRLLKIDISKILESAGQEGVNALSSATPIESGKARDSWDYKIERSGSSTTIVWTNSDIENGFPVVIMLQYGHGTGTGGYVQGRDFINPAMKPIFDKIADKVWKAVKSA